MRSWHAAGMGLGAQARRLLGRQRERAVLDRLLDAARDGHGAVLVVHGEAGVGKTALLEYAVAAAEDFRVVRTAGVEAEMELAFAALHQLCSPSLDLIERLPDPQREALEVALGLGTGQAPNPFLVGLAVLNLLSEAAEEQPLLVRRRRRAMARPCIGARARVRGPPPARREDRAGLRGAGADRRARGVGRSFDVEPLGHRDARALLDSVLPARLDERRAGADRRRDGR